MQPLPRLLQPLMLTLALATDRELARTIDYLKVENKLLRERLPGPIRLNPKERRLLLEHGLPLGTELRLIITIVQYDTFRRWARASIGGKLPAKTGRPHTPEDKGQRVVRIAIATGWGVNRILGKLKKLGVESISRTTVRNILREHGLNTGPERGMPNWCARTRFLIHSMGRFGRLAEL